MSNLLPRLVILPIHDILPHEEYDRWILSRIVSSLRLEGAMHDPLLVDEATFTILDGTHRYWALRKLGCKAVPAALYNYQSPAIKIGCWYRCLDRAPPLEILDSLKARKMDREEGLKMLRAREVSLSIILQSGSYVFDWGSMSGMNVYHAYQLMAFLEGGFKSRGYGVNYATEMDAVDMLKSGNVKAVIAPPPITKEEVISVIKDHKLFPKKSTRHILPYRPMGVNVPLSWLQGDTDVASRKLEELLSRGTFKRMLSGIVIGGRRYEEEVYIFELKTSDGGLDITSD